jgi:hypothetical protein
MYTCPVCKSGVGGSPNITIVGPLACWREDCPGKQERPKLVVVK